MVAKWKSKLKLRVMERYDHQHKITTFHEFSLLGEENGDRHKLRVKNAISNLNHSNFIYLAAVLRVIILLRTTMMLRLLRLGLR
jgi:hypothetical protein